jgi:glycerol-3-phosphate dehydrogenase
VVSKLFDHDRAYIFQNADRRIIFAIPYESDYTLIGTTDVDFHGDPGRVAVTVEEIAYLCEAANEYFAASIDLSDVVWSYSGVRSLQEDGSVSAQDATRDFALLRDARPGEPPLLSIVGGKITTYRLLAEQAIRKLPELRPRGRLWTHKTPLPGGDFPHDGLGQLTHDLAATMPLLGVETVDRMAKTYGALAQRILAGVVRREDLGVHFGADLYEREVAHLVRHEWAMTAEDILWRRTKLGLRLTDAESARLSEWLATYNQRGSPAA